MSKQHSTTTVTFALICFSIVILGANGQRCKSRPECPTNTRCRKANCQQCLKVEPVKLVCKACRKSRHNNRDVNCRKVCRAFIYCERKACFIKCPKVADGACECALSNKSGMCVNYWSEYELIKCKDPEDNPTECKSKLWKKKCQPSPSTSPSPTPTATPSPSISPSVSPSPSSTPLIPVNKIEKTPVDDVIGKKLSIPFDANLFSVGDMVTIAGIKVSGGTKFAIIVNEGEKKFVEILSDVFCSVDTKRIPLEVREAVSVKDIGMGSPGLFYEVETTPFNSNSPCESPFFEFEILNAS